MFEHFFQCPYCWEEVSVLLDPSITHQTYIEDCEVCCRPIEFLNSESEHFWSLHQKYPTSG